MILNIKNFRLSLILLAILFMALTVPACASSQKFVAVSTGVHHTLALADDGSVWQWGNMYIEQHNELGDESASMHQVPINGVIAIAAGSDDSYALKSDGTVWAWGPNYYGELGDGTTEPRYTPVQVQSISNVTEISGGSLYAVALKSDGTVWTWGCNHNNNNDGRLGDSTRDNQLTPVLVKGLTNVKSIMGPCFAIKEDGTVWAWGLALNMTDSTEAFQVPGLNNIKAITMDFYYDHALFIKENGTVWAWGYNDQGEFGNGTAFIIDHQYTTEPVKAKGLTNVKAVSAAMSTSMALKDDGTVWVWGLNGGGQLGTGTLGEIELTPVMIQGLSGVVAISSSDLHSAFLKDDGSIWECGENEAGQIGNGSIVNAYATTVFTGDKIVETPIKVIGPEISVISSADTTNTTSNSTSPIITHTINSSTVVTASPSLNQDNGLLSIVVVVCALILLAGCIIYFGVIRKL